MPGEYAGKLRCEKQVSGKGGRGIKGERRGRDRGVGGESEERERRMKG